MPLWALAGCYDLLKSNGVEGVELIGYSQIVRQVIEATILSLLDKGAIPRRTNLEAKKMFGAKPKEPVISFDIERTIESNSAGEITKIEDFRSTRDPYLETVTMRDYPPTKTAFDIGQEVEKMLLGHQDPDIRKPVQLQETTPIKPASLDLFETPAADTAWVKEKSPKDRFVALLDKDDTSPEVRQAILVLYKSLPVDLWGSDLAESQINLLITRHLNSKGAPT